MADETPLEFARRILAAQPFSVLMGAEMIDFGEGRAEIALPLRPELGQQHGFAHGGAVGYLADVTMAFAGGSVLHDSVTLEYKINFARPAKGERLIGRARVVSSGRTQAVVAGEIYAVEGGAEKICAAAQGTIHKI